MGTQKEITRQVIERGADYVLVLKGNQGRLYQEVQDCFALGSETGLLGTGHDHHETLNGGNGRTEKRHYWSILDPEHLAYLDEKGEWAGLKSIDIVESERWVGEEVSWERRYYLSSLPGNAPELGQAIRGH